MTIDLPTYIPLNEATRRYRIGAQALTQMVEKGTIRAVRIDGSLAVAETDIDAMALRDELWARVKYLDAVTISMSQACEKYEEINFASLSRWVARGYIRTVGNSSRGGGRGRRRLLNEADVAYTASLLRVRGKKPGKRVFTTETLPPHLAKTAT